MKCFIFVNIAGMGEDFATNLGINYNRILYMGLAVVALVTVSVVITVGSIPFIGLIVPNIVSLYKGDRIKGTLIDTALIGSVFLLACDIFGRIVIFPYEISIGLTVGVVGVIIGPMLALVGLSAAVLSKCKIKIANEEGDTVIDLGEFSEDKFNTIKDMVSTKAKDVKNAIDKNKEKESDTYPNNETKKSDDEIVISLDKQSFEVKDEKDGQ